MGLAQTCRGEFEPAAVHFIDYFVYQDVVLFLRGRIVALGVDVVHGFQHGVRPFQCHFGVEVGHHAGKMCRIEFLRIIYLVPGHSEGHHYVGHRVGTREHVLNLDTGVNVPLGYAVFLHHCQLFLLQRTVLSYVFHDLE